MDITILTWGAPIVTTITWGFLIWLFLDNRQDHATLEEKTDKQAEKMDRRLDGQDQLLEKILEQLRGIERWMGRADGRMDHMDNTVNDVREVVARLDERSKT